MDTVIKVENLSKKYIIGRRQSEHYGALRDVLADGARNLVQRIARPFKSVSGRVSVPGLPILPPLSSLSENGGGEEFYALRDLSFEIKRGDRVGIIGRNGAGKSTLLKILSRITEPTSGRIAVRGRVASLLEVGTGFHPELTGRENVYLNGAILGMSRGEIRKKFDEIVAFAEVEKFLDTPVKRYSSGMYVRLAFAVAAHLEPEILIVDEVLAVGDIQFQRKCLGKMEDVSLKEGRTVLFVSHNMGAITALCDNGMVLKDGKINYLGTTDGALSRYLDNDAVKGDELSWFQDNDDRKYDDVLTIDGYRLIDSENNLCNRNLLASKRYFIEINYDIKKKNPDIRIAYGIYNHDGYLIGLSSAHDNGEIDFGSIELGAGSFSAPVPIHLLDEGSYFIEVLCLIENMGWILPTLNDSRLKFQVFRDNEKNPHHVHKLGGLRAPVSFQQIWTAS